MYKYGEIKRTIYDANDIIVDNNIAQVVLRNKKQEIVGHALIDSEDVGIINNYKWHIKKSKNTDYAVCNIKGKSIFMHQMIMNYYGDKDIDHIDHNGLNNCKRNLRIISHSLNIMNQYNDNNGIWHTSSNKYQAHIMVNGKDIYLGTFDTFEEAKQKRIEYEATLF